MIVILKATASPLPRDCPRCRRTGCRGCVVGHGRRRRTCLDQERSEIEVRRGLCHACGGTTTFLPPELRPYRSYSLRVVAITLRQLRRGTSYAALDLALHDPDRFPDPSTVRRWWRDFPRAAQHRRLVTPRETTYTASAERRIAMAARKIVPILPEPTKVRRIQGTIAWLDRRLLLERNLERMTLVDLALSLDRIVLGNRPSSSNSLTQREHPKETP